MAVVGALGREELVKLSKKDVTDLGDFVKVNFRHTKTKVPKEFIIREGCLLAILRKYLSLRSDRTTHDRFFLSYRNGKCRIQPVGINNIGAIPRKVATYLGLKNPASYTGHSLRRSSTSLFANSAADLSVLKVENSVTNNYQIATRNLDEKIVPTDLQDYNLVDSMSRDVATTSRDVVSTYTPSQEITKRTVAERKYFHCHQGTIIPIYKSIP